MGSETKMFRAMLTVPNGLSVLRLLGVPLFLWLVLGPREDGWALVVLAVSGFSDWLDGQLARAWGQTSRLGELLDPAADRLYIFAVLIGLGFREIIPVWFAAALVLRDVVLLSCGPILRRHGYGALPVHFLGKAATFNLLYAFPLLLLGGGNGSVSMIAKIVGWAFAIWGTALYWWAAGLYVVQVRQLVRLDRGERRTIPLTQASRRERSPTGRTAEAEHRATGSDGSAVSQRDGEPSAAIHGQASVKHPAESSASDGDHEEGGR